MKKYKSIALLFLIVISIIAIHFITYERDYKTVISGGSPIFILRETRVKDGGTIIYYGLGYQIIKWKQFYIDKINNKEGYKVGIEIYKFPNYRDLKEDYNPRCDLKFVGKSNLIE